MEVALQQLEGLVVAEVALQQVEALEAHMVADVVMGCLWGSCKSMDQREMLEDGGEMVVDADIRTLVHKESR